MRKILTLQTIITAVLLFVLPLNVMAETNISISTSRTIQLRKQPTNNDNHKVEFEKESHRTSVRLTQCTISKNDGVQISGFDDEIISYEVWNETGTDCIALYTDEDNFVDYIFNCIGSYQIIFRSDEYIFYGYIEI